MKVLTLLPVRVALLPLLLLGLLSSCAVYDSVFHPHRLPTPKMDATTKAKVRAAEKARHKGLSLKAADETSTSATATDGGDPAAPSAAPAGADEKKKTMSYSDLPEGTRIKYDKQGLVKKSFLDRRANDGRKLHHYDTRPLTPREASRENRKLRKKGHTDHRKDAPAPRDKAPTDPALDTGPDPGPPPASPPAPAEALPPAKSPKAAPTKPTPAVKGKKAAPAKLAPTPPAPKPTKAKKSKVPVPRPDPTQPAPGQ